MESDLYPLAINVPDPKLLNQTESQFMVDTLGALRGKQRVDENRFESRPAAARNSTLHLYRVTVFVIFFPADLIGRCRA